MKSSIVAYAGVLIVLGACSSPAGESEDAQSVRPAAAEKPRDLVLTFEEHAVDGLPPGWRIEGTKQVGPLATWKVVVDETAPSRTNVLALTSPNHDSGSTFNLCWTDDIRLQHGAVEVRFKSVGGEGDQGGGVLWRAKDKDNYYVCRANPVEGNFRVYCVKDGERKQLGTAKIELADGEWHRLRIETEGNRIVCALDGKDLLDVSDATFPDEGGVGVWTKGDAATRFDDFTIQR